MVPDRVRWAIDTLAIEPDDRILEIGCGGGVAAASVCERLHGGKLLAIDRSRVQIAHARRRNETHVAAGRLELVAVDVAELDVGSERFDTAFAINVNVFWTTAAATELERVRAALEDNGRLFLFYAPPSPARAREIAARVVSALAGAGFGESETMSPARGLVCFVSTLG